jgi:hypothetical protein
VHTDITLAHLQEHIEAYNKLTQVDTFSLQILTTLADCSIIQDFAHTDLGLTFAWPKHHNLDHVIELLRRKGPTDNYESGLGESLHPQVKTDYHRSSGQTETTDIQVTYCQFCVVFIKHTKHVDDSDGTRTR